MSRRRSYDPKNDRKVQQLVAQIRRTISLVLNHETKDELVCELILEDVLPWPNASRLLVVLRHPSAEPGEVLQRLDVHKNRLREMVAGAIHRKRAPELLFEVLALEEVRV